MRDFWSDFFYDLHKISEENLANAAGKSIKMDLDAIENAINNCDLQNAVDLICEARQKYWG